jgi:NADH:ubiquinone oxidoreductase subunit E
MEKVKVEICCGTACYLLGAANMMNLEDQIPAEWRDKVEIEARTCLELCEKENLGGAPYVRINDAEIMAQATPEKLLTRIGELLEGAV